MAHLNQAGATAQVQVESQALGAAAGEMAAEAALEKAKGGARTQEIQQAKSAVSGAKANLDNAQAQLIQAEVSLGLARVKVESEDWRRKSNWRNRKSGRRKPIYSPRNN